MAAKDGNGWVTCAQGHRHWGLFGAAGLLAFVASDGADPRVLLQHRAGWSHHGGTWGLPGGARDSHETAVAAALREAGEEIGFGPAPLRIRGVYADDHGGWSYQTVLAQASAAFDAVPISDETTGACWLAAAELGSVELHPGFAASWPGLRDALAALTVIVDGANVVGSRPDGWWRDRAGAAARLAGELAALAEQGVTDMPVSVPGPRLARWLPDFVLVLEGAARPSGADAAPDGTRLRIVAARASGDEAIADLAASLPGRRLVVTADRELRARCVAAGAAVTGPAWLLGQLRALSVLTSARSARDLDAGLELTAESDQAHRSRRPARWLTCSAARTRSPGSWIRCPGTWTIGRCLVATWPPSYTCPARCSTGWCRRWPGSHPAACAVGCCWSARRSGCAPLTCAS